MTTLKTDEPGTYAHTLHIREDIHHNGRDALEKVEQEVREARARGRMTSPMVAHLIDTRLCEIAENISIGAHAIVADRVPETGAAGERARQQMDDESDEALDDAMQGASEVDWIGLEPDEAAEKLGNIVRAFSSKWAEHTQQSAYAAADDPDDNRSVRQEILQEAEAMIRGLTGDGSETLDEYGL